MSPPGTPVLWLWVTRAILQNDRVEDFPADDAAPPREGRHAGTDLQIHERLFHHQTVTAWASHDEVGFCRTPTHRFLFETTARRSPYCNRCSKRDSRRAGLDQRRAASRSRNVPPRPRTTARPSTIKRSSRTSCVSIIPLLCARSPARGELSFLGSPASPGDNHEGPSLLGSFLARTVLGPVGAPHVKNHGLVNGWPAVAASIGLGDRRSRNSTCRGSPLFASHER